MTDKVQKLLSEIATRKLCTMEEHMAFYNDKAKDDYRLLSEIEEFIKALQEEPVSEDLEEEIQKHLKECLNVKFPTTDIESIKKDVEYTARHFAQWQKQQLMKQAIEVQVNPLLGETFVGCKVSGYKVGEKVKLIIIKED